jgi:hypothetical protein
MEKLASPELPADGGLPRPIVLRPEDFAEVAAAGMSLAAMPSLGTKVLIAGGIPAGPMMAASF